MFGVCLCGFRLFPAPHPTLKKTNSHKPQSLIQMKMKMKDSPRRLNYEEDLGPAINPKLAEGCFTSQL